MAVNVIKISRISPETNSVEPLILPLTFFDLLWIKSSPTKRVTFYRLTESSHDAFYSVILPKLERSLSLTLTHFLPLSGHLKWNPQDPKPHIVVFPEDTVSLTVAESSADFSRISDKGLRPEAELRALVPELPVSSDSASVLSLQITLFPNQGFCIGSADHHAAMPSWTDKRRQTGLEPKILELMSYLDKDNARSLRLSPFKEVDDDVVRITLEINQENVHKLKERAKNESTYSADLHLSTFVVTFAYVWTCMVKTRGGEPDRPVRFRYAADFRNRLDPPVPETYFGNCVVSVVLDEYKAKMFLGEDGFVNGVKILSDSVKGCGSRGVESIWEQYEEGKKNFKMGTQALSVSGSNQFGMYGPVNTEVMSIYGNNQISMSARRDGTGGVEIGVSLKKCEMDVFISLFTNGLDN
ncbi:hypothetical protein YC2023_046088 [Brassica napus]